MPGENEEGEIIFTLYVSKIYREIAVAPSCVAVRVLVLSAGASDAEGKLFFGWIFLRPNYFLSGLDTLACTLRPAIMSTGSWRPWPTTRLY